MLNESSVPLINNVPRMPFSSFLKLEIECVTINAFDHDTQIFTFESYRRPLQMTSPTYTF